MSKPSDDLSALFRSLRPDETISQASTSTVARDAEQRWPLFKAVAPEKPQETPALTAQERQRWVNQEKPEFSGRKPALSLPGLSDKMSKGLDKMSARSVENTAAVKPAVRRESEDPTAERAFERPRSAPIAQAPKPGPLENRIVNVAKTLAAEPAVVSGAGSRPFDKKPAVAGQAPVQAVAERGLPAAGCADDSLKSIFGRLESKTHVAAKPPGSRSSFLDRLGKR